MLSTSKQFPRCERPRRRAVAHAATALVIAGAMALPGLCTLAVGAPSETNQSLPGLADTPGTKPSLPAMDRALNGGVLKIEHGLAVLDSDVLLKIYVYAYSGLPVDDSAILTENTENIVPPVPVQASAAQAQAIERLIQAAKAHPDVLIKVNDIALDAYDKAAQAYPLDNRLFIKGVGYYFDNSPYHYVYTDAQSFRKLHCTDPKTIAILDPAIGNFEHFSMDIVAHVQGAQGKSHRLELDLRSITLRDTVGGALITQAKGS
ncbi:hypothetical protein [Thiomonas sp. FB-Cd]|uniref:hypothetical protein n=1 Tax=Thiomonas sp. FB-Cd TaxID=1158292 RepID=UPI0012DC787C|nr:hypothetical protein [Thiomonas sp. FB-Cd]